MPVIVVIYITIIDVFFSEKSKTDFCTTLCTFIIDSKYEMPVIVVYYIYITIIDICTYFIDLNLKADYCTLPCNLCCKIEFQNA